MVVCGLCFIENEGQGRLSPRCNKSWMLDKWFPFFAPFPTLMSPSHSTFIISTLPVGQNVVKNILFRIATIVLSFVLYRLFAFLAFKMGDYTSFLMFGEDLIQKGFYIFSRKFNKQALLVLALALTMIAAGFYDTMLWGIDSPGYITKTTTVNASQLSSQMLDSPGYLILLSNPQNNLSLINLNDTFGSNLYSPGLNFTLPGVNVPGTAETVPAVVPISINVPPNIWLDSEGWAVGPDNTIMIAPDMNLTTFCGVNNVGDDGQAWRCTIRNSDALYLFDNPMGRPQIWWDVNTSEFLVPSRRDNPWQSLSTGADTGLMKQIFTLTKGTRRHTFLQTTLKVVMTSRLPLLLDDEEITDFMRKTWSTSPPGTALPPSVETLVDLVIGAKNNQTSLSFGTLFNIGNTSVASYSTDYLNVENSANGAILYASLRFASTTITLIRSETIDNAPVPFETCDQAYSNIATGGVVREVNCYSAYLFNLTDQTQSTSRFLGQMDTSSAFIMSDILGDGTLNTSNSALDPNGMAWYLQNADHIDQLLISRGLILGGVRADVQVDVQHNEAAVSYLQVLLIIFPFMLGILIFSITFRQPMGYYLNSFLAAVYSTTHLDKASCENVGYIRSPPEIVLKSIGAHVVLGTPNEGVIAVVSQNQALLDALPVDQEPLLPGEASSNSGLPAEKVLVDPELGLEAESNPARYVHDQSSPVRE